VPPVTVTLFLAATHAPVATRNLGTTKCVQLEMALRENLFRYLMRERRAKIEFIRNFLQSLVTRPDGNAGLQARGRQQ
jgi:hypothetical protein